MRVNKGIFPNESAALRAVVERLSLEIRPHEIYLFGSRARGDHRPDSDFDLLVITRTSDGEAGADFNRMRKPLKGLFVDVDIVPIRIDDFDAEMQSGLSIVPAAMRDAIRVYDQLHGIKLSTPE